eukprot:2270559-Amphidinium_carterae.1
MKKKKKKRPREGFLIPLVPRVPSAAGSSGLAGVDGHSAVAKAPRIANNACSSVGQKEGVSVSAESRSDGVQVPERRRQDET